jgi:two-component system phosphate regulon sensor histidine kinase PhoR
MWPLFVFLTCVALVLLQFWWQERRNRKLRAKASREYTEAALQQQREISAQSQAQQQALFNSMIEGVLLLDGQGRVQLVNESLRKFFKFAAEIRGQTVLQAFCSPELTSLTDRLQKEKNIFDAEMELHGGEQRRSLQVNAAIVTDRAGGEQGEIFVFHDVTRLKQLENIRQEFVANVSHELRTPLSLIKGFAETLLDGAKDDPELSTRFLQKIDKHSDRLLFLIEDLLTISRLESGQIALNLQPVDLRELAQRVCDDLAVRAAEQNARLENQIPAHVTAWADADRLQQVFFNLAENAIKYGKMDGCVTIGVGETLGDKIEITVADNGPGIPPEARARIFERFYRLDRARSRETGGTGLGLSIVKHIVQAHGGEVWAKSDLQKGAAFSFTVPKHRGE